MDIFTHSFSGLALGSFIKRKFNKEIIILFFVSALLPDIDSIFLFAGKLNGHRMASHSLICSFLLAFISTLIFYLIFKRKIAIHKLYGISIMGIWMHILLDTLVVWGAPLLYPLSDKFYSLNIYLTVIDPYIFTGYLIFLLTFIFSKLGYFKINLRKMTGVLTMFILIIFVSRFLFYFQAKQITSLDNFILVPVNEEISDFFLQKRWKAISSINKIFEYEIIDVLSQTINEKGMRVIYSGENDCPKFTQSYLYVDNDRIGDIRYSSYLIENPNLPQNCLFGVGLNK